MNYMQPYHDLLLSVHMLAILVDICYTLIDKDNERPELLMYGLYVVYGIIIFTGSHFSLRCQYHYIYTCLLLPIKKKKKLLIIDRLSFERHLIDYGMSYLEIITPKIMVFSVFIPPN